MTPDWPGMRAEFPVLASRTSTTDIYRQARELGLDALLDDRDERPGVKFKDADLIGIPWRVTVGKKLANRLVELTERAGKKSCDVPVADVARVIAERAASAI